MNRIPPTARRPPSRGLGPGRWLAAAIVLVVTGGGGACASPPDEGRAGLVVASIGPIIVTDADGRPETLDGPPGDIRFVTASNGRIAASTADGRIFVSDAPDAGEARAWRTLARGESSTLTPSGVDLSPDGNTLAIVLGDPETSGLELITIDVEAGNAATRSIDLMANGPPAWFGPELVALEVIRPDSHSGIATVTTPSGEVAITDARGFSPSVTGDGSRLAVADPGSGHILVGDTEDWLAGDLDVDPGITGPAGSSVQDVAIDADGNRLAVAYAADSGASSSIVMYRVAGTGWESVSTIPVRADAPVSIDWLE